MDFKGWKTEDLKTEMESVRSQRRALSKEINNLDDRYIGLREELSLRKEQAKQNLLNDIPEE